MGESETVWQIASGVSLLVARGHWLHPMMSKKEIPIMNNIEDTAGTQRVLSDSLNCFLIF